MSRQKVVKYVELTPRNEQGKQRASYHGARWVLRQETTEPYRGAPEGEWLGVRSRDGSSFLWVRKFDDQDFTVRLCQ